MRDFFNLLWHAIDFGRISRLGPIKLEPNLTTQFTQALDTALNFRPMH